MKKIILMVILVFGLVGCVEQEDDSKKDDNTLINELQGEIDYYMNELTVLEADLADKQMKLADSSDEIVYLNDEIAQTRSVLESLQSELEEARSKISELELELEESLVPVIKNLMVKFEDYDPVTNRAGAFVFDTNYQKVFLEFGASVNNGTKELPTFEYRTAIDAEVFIVADAFVTNIIWQEDTEDYEIHTAPSMTNSSYMISYDHVKNVTVEIGDEVTAGQLLGTVGTWTDTMGRTELMVTIPTSQSGIGQCPFKFFDERLIDYYEAKVTKLMMDWETAKGDDSIYDEENHVWAGCKYEEMYDD